MGVFPKGASHFFVRSTGIQLSPIDRAFLPLEAKSMKRSKRNPNYKALVLTFTPGCPHSIAEWYIEQEVRPTQASLEATNNRVVETLEGLRDRLGLDYRVNLPTDHRDMAWWSASRVVTVDA